MLLFSTAVADAAADVDADTNTADVGVVVGLIEV